jgi:cobalt-zinc-cadmium efflux system membrane fusion protein
VARPAVLGQVVEPTASLFRIADPSRLWVQLEVFERDLARVRVDDTAEITSEAHPGRVFRGTVGHLAATIAPETRTARVRIAVANPDDALRPGQFVTARVRSGAAVGRPALVVHRSAVVQFEGQPAVFVATGRGEFEVRPLELGVADGDDLEAVRGISDGEALVIAGAFALKSELLR